MDGWLMVMDGKMSWLDRWKGRYVGIIKWIRRSVGQVGRMDGDMSGMDGYMGG